MELTKHNFMTEFKKWRENKEYRPFWLTKKNIHAFVRYLNSITPKLKDNNRIINMRYYAKANRKDLQAFNKFWLDLRYRAILKKAVFELVDNGIWSTGLTLDHFKVAEGTILETHTLRARHNGLNRFVKIIVIRETDRTICDYCIDSELLDLMPKIIKQLEKLPKLDDKHLPYSKGNFVFE